jgi:indole-3-glycerol phosphate synthase
MTILDTIVARKWDEIAQRKAAVSEVDLKNMPSFHRPVNSARAAILAQGSTGVIAEFKRKSPSKVSSMDRADVAETTRGYVLPGPLCCRC